LILMYHGVVKSQNNDISVNHLSLRDFELQIAYFKKNFDIVSLDELFDKSHIKSNHRKKTLAITFDDGYENNYTNAFPVLKKYNIPATIFVVADCIQNPGAILWYDYLDILKEKINYSILPGSEVPLASKDFNKLRKISNLRELRVFLKTLNTRDKKIVLETLLPFEKYQSLLAKKDKEYLKLLSVSQMKEMLESGLIEIGSHSLSHPNLDILDQKEMIFELAESKRLLENGISRTINSIAFPDGAYNEQVKHLSIQEGYRHLLAVDLRLNDDRADRAILPRYCISNTTTPESNFIQVHMAFRTLGF